jgi:hypothetical protein
LSGCMGFASNSNSTPLDHDIPVDLPTLRY